MWLDVPGLQANETGPDPVTGKPPLVFSNSRYLCASGRDFCRYNEYMRLSIGVLSDRAW